MIEWTQNNSLCLCTAGCIRFFGAPLSLCVLLQSIKLPLQNLSTASPIFSMIGCFLLLFICRSRHWHARSSMGRRLVARVRRLCRQYFRLYSATVHVSVKTRWHWLQCNYSRRQQEHSEQRQRFSTCFIQDIGVDNTMDMPNKNLAIANRSRVSCINTNNITMTLKSGLVEVTQCHWKWCHSKAWVRFPIRLLGKGNVDLYSASSWEPHL